MSLGAASATLNTKAVAVLAAVAMVGIGGIGGAVAGVGPTGGLDVPFAAEQEPDPAPETSVRLESSGSTVQVGGTATYDVVVGNASAGVGDHAYVVSVDDPDVASITDASPRGNQSGETAGVSIADDGSAVNVTAAPTAVGETGGVVVATVAVSGDAVGSTDVDLRVDRLDTEAGDSYDVTAASGAAIDVEPNPDPAAFRVSNLNASRNATQGTAFDVTVAVTNDGDLEATRTVRYGFDLDGDGTVESNETVAAREVTLAGHDREVVAFDGVNATDVDPGSRVHGVVTENDSVTGVIDVEAAAEPAPAPETAVLLRPTDADETAAADETTDVGETTSAVRTIDAGETATYDVVVANASAGVGAYDFRIDANDVTYATVTDVSVRGDPSDATTAIEVIDDGSAVNVTAVPADADGTGSVVVATAEISGHAVGSTDVDLRVDALGTANGTAYDVTAANGTSIEVESGYEGVSVPTDDAGDADETADVEEFTRDEISRAKYGVAFETLGSQTTGAVQAIYNRQPFAGGAGPGDVRTRDEMSEDRYDAPFSELDREAAIEVQNEYDAQFGPLPSDPAHSRDDISRAKYDADFADLGAERAAAVQAIYNRQPFAGDAAPGEIRTRDEITHDRYGLEFADVSRETTIEVQNDYDAQFDDEAE